MLHVTLGLVVLVVPLPEVPVELVLLRDQTSAAMVLVLVLYLICRSVKQPGALPGLLRYHAGFKLC